MISHFNAPLLAHSGSPITHKMPRPHSVDEGAELSPTKPSEMNETCDLTTNFEFEAASSSRSAKE
jgi:hypothetical protein